MEQILTFKYRIKDSSTKTHLYPLAAAVNFVWNYINNLSYRSIKEYSRFLSAFSIDKYLADGAAAELNLHATTLQEVSKTYAKCRKQFKKNKLQWRSRKRSLGWIPVKASGLKQLSADTWEYKGIKLRVWKDRSLPDGAKIKTAAIVQDASDRWYLCITFSYQAPEQHQFPDKECGIDLGSVDQVCVADIAGNITTYSRPSFTAKYAAKLAAAQRANKAKQVKNISAKIANSRKDWNHKITTQIAAAYGVIKVGDLQAAKLMDCEQHSAAHNKNFADAAIHQIKSFLEYKAGMLGGNCEIVSEAGTTFTCSKCDAETGPRGSEGLKIREWTCSECGTLHDRNGNSATLILRMGHHTPQAAPKAAEGNPFQIS